MNSSLNFVIIPIIVAAIIPLSLFIYYYHRYSPYKKNPIGLTLMRQKWALDLTFILILVARLYGDYPGRDWITLILFTFLVIMFWRTFFELRNVQKKNPTGFDRYKLFWARLRKNPGGPANLEDDTHEKPDYDE